MEPTGTQMNWGFFGRWTGITTLTGIAGVAIVIGVMWTVASALEPLLGMTAALAVGGGLFGASIGLGIGGGQAIALRENALNVPRWLVASTLSAGIATAAAFASIFGFMGGWDMPLWQIGLVVGSNIGLSMGVAQWLFLRRIVSGAAAWVLITLVAFTIGFVAAFGVDGEGRELISFSLMALIAAAGTGLGATWLMRRAHPALTV